MRVILGLDRPTSGRALVDGRPYADSRAPLAHVGALLDGKAFDKTRSARNHLRAVGATVGVGTRRVDEVLDLVGLTDVAGKAAGSFSLGMGQRLGIATALLADPDGIKWIRALARQLAAEGRTVFISSHLMTEMELTADHLIIVGHGKVITDQPMTEFIDQASGERVEVAAPRVADLARAIAGPGVEISAAEEGVIEVRGLSAARIGEVAAESGIVLHQLATRRLSLEEAFMTLTDDAVDFHGHTERTSA